MSFNVPGLAVAVSTWYGDIVIFLNPSLHTLLISIYNLQYFRNSKYLTKMTTLQHEMAHTIDMVPHPQGCGACTYLRYSDTTAFGDAIKQDCKL